MTDFARRGVCRYLIVAFLLSYAGQIAIWMAGGLEGRLFGPLAPLLMFSPAIAALLAVRAENSRFGDLLRGWARVGSVLIAVMVPALTALVTALLINRLFGAGPAPLEMQGGRMIVPADSRLFINGEQSVWTFALSFSATSVWLSVVGGLLAIGEEIGWRGYLQPRLSGRFGGIGGMVLVGLAWGYWHVPLILQGYVFPEAKIIGAFLLFPLITIALSLFLGWLRESSDSIWPAVLAHGSYNAAFGTMVFGMEMGRHALAAYVIIVALTVLTGLLSILAIRRNPADVVAALSFSTPNRS